MTSMLADRAARRRGITFTILLVITALLMAFSSNPAIREIQNGIGFAFRPIQGALDTVAGGIASIATAVTEIDHLRVDNAALRDENARLEIENAQAEEIKRENDLLTGLLQLQSGYEFQTAAASVIGRDSQEFRRLILLDKGTADGIAIGDVVIASGGALAGRVTEVGLNSASVVLLTDGESTVVGQLVSNAAQGVVVGQLGGVLVMNQIDSSEVVAVGDEVVTAGNAAGGVRSPYPKGLLIGQVVEVELDANDVVQTAFLQPTADIEKLEYVLVILDYEGGLPPIEEQPVDCSGDEGTLPAGEQPCFTPTPKPEASPKVTPKP